MKKRSYHLSTYIAVSIISLVVLSTLTVSCTLYFSLTNSLNIEFEERVKAESREIFLSLESRIQTVKTRLHALTNDNTVRVTLMLGAEGQLKTHLRSVYSNDPSLNFFVQSLNKGQWYSSSTQEIPDFKAWQALSSEHEETIITNDMSEDGFKIIHSAKVNRQKDTIGRAAAVYLFKNDDLLKATLTQAHECRLVIIDDGNAWNLLDGKIADIPLSYLTMEKEPNSIEYLDTADGNYAAISDDFLPNIIVLADLFKLQEAKETVLIHVLFPAFVVICFSLIISLIISRRMAVSLKQLSDVATGIIQGKPELSFFSKPSSIREFNSMSRSLAMMVEHLDQLRQMERYQELFEGGADIVFIHDFQGKLINANKIACTQFELEEDKLHSYLITQIIPDELHTDLLKTFSSLQNQDGQKSFSFSYTDRFNLTLHFECYIKRINYGGVNVLLNVARDITDRKQAEEALVQSYDTLNTIMDSIKATIVACDVVNKKVLFMNRQMKEISGGDFTDKPCEDTLNNSICGCMKGTCNNGEQYDEKTVLPAWEALNPRNNRWYLHYDSYIKWVDGRLVKFQVAFDITEIKMLAIRQEEAERQLRKSQKLEAVGTLAAGVAHDLNNILSGIVSYPDMLLATLPKESPLRRPLNSIKESGLKASATVDDLLTLARRGVNIHEVVNLNDIVTDYLNSPEHNTLLEEHRGVDVYSELDLDLLNILGSPIHLLKTIMNLITNAVEAIENEGKVIISTSIENVSSPQPQNPNIQNGEYIVLTVADNGTGISSKDLEKIFEPFFSTKVMGRSGTGLGMAVVWGTVEDHEGYISIDSKLGLGTTFKLYFPVTRVELLKEQTLLTEEDYSGNGELILVVDDVREQREIASLMFTQLGYRVVVVPSGEEAVKYLMNHTVDLVILDMILEGGMGGLETYREILQISPKQKAIITSGYSKTSDVKEAIRLGAGQYIKKPFLFNEIAEAVANEMRH